MEGSRDARKLEMRNMDGSVLKGLRDARKLEMRSMDGGVLDSSRDAKIEMRKMEAVYTRRGV